MTGKEFITLHIEALWTVKKADAKKKELAVLLFQYLLSFDAQTVKFNIKDVAHHTGMEIAFLNQPHDTFKNPTYAAPLMDMFELSEILIDENKYQSLLESVLLLLMSTELALNPKTYLNYSILSSINKSDKEYEFFASDFEVSFSDHFWNELSEVN